MRFDAVVPDVPATTAVDDGVGVSSSFCKEVVGVSGLVQQMILKFSDESSSKLTNGLLICLSSPISVSSDVRANH